MMAFDLFIEKLMKIISSINYGPNDTVFNEKSFDAGTKDKSKD